MQWQHLMAPRYTQAVQELQHSAFPLQCAFHLIHVSWCTRVVITRQWVARPHCRNPPHRGDLSFCCVGQVPHSTRTPRRPSCPSCPTRNPRHLPHALYPTTPHLHPTPRHLPQVPGQHHLRDRHPLALPPHRAHRPGAGRHVWKGGSCLKRILYNIINPTGWE